MRKLIAVVGDSMIERDGLKFRMAYEMGKALVDNGYRVQSGGMKGIMEAAFMGAKASEKYREGDTLALVPSFDRTKVNDYADIIVPTGLDVMRNVLVANADAVIAIGGGAGTLSEIANAWALMRLVIAFDNVDGWSAKLAGQPVDHRKRYPFDDRVFAVDSADKAIAILKEKLDLYTVYHQGITLVE